MKRAKAGSMHHSRALIILATSLLTGCASGAKEDPPPDDELDVAAPDSEVEGSSDDGLEPKDDGSFGVELTTGDGVAEDSSGGTDGTDAPGPDPITECPAQVPGAVPCDGSFSCKWGEHCCCGSCDDSERCECKDGRMDCTYIDHCLGRVCSPGCELNEYTTPDGCTPVGEILSTVEGLSAEVAAQHATCAADADCTTVRVETGCGALCPISVQSSAVTDVVSQVTQLAAPWCDPVATAGGPGMGGLVCPDTPAGACVQGQCKAVAVCDPEYFPPGTGCDDGDSCTTGDQCSASGCIGTPLDCDDGNACTVDSCTPEVGCTTTAAAGFCPGASSCSVGGYCAAGECMDTGLTGWSRYYAKAGDENGRGFVPRAGGGWVLGAWQYVADGQPVKGLLVGVSAAGDVDWQHEFVGGVSKLVALPSGNIAFFSENALRWVSSAGELTPAVSLGQPFLYYEPHAVSATADDGLVMAGPSTVSAETQVLRVIRFTAAGAVSWNRDYANVHPYGGSSSVASHTSGILVASASVVVGAQGASNDLRLVRLDSEGDVVSDAIVAPASTNDEPNRVVPLVQDGLLLASVSVDYSSGKEFTSYLRRLDANDAIVWERTWPDIARVLDSYDGGVVLLQDYFGSAPFTANLVRVTNDGAVSPPVAIPSQAFPTTWIVEGAVDPGGVNLFGYGQPSPPQSDLWLLRVTAPCFDPPCDATCP
ncbi:MAG: hypothetical protein IV100_11695 [Myxococcales bacterium]|nr:hypothetical protein [Myxococcales bacterium]